MDTAKHYNYIIETCERIYNDDFSGGEYCHETSFRWGFEQGYSIAEKDFEMTWEDIWKIVHSYMELNREIKGDRSPEKICQKTLDIYKRESSHYKVSP